MNGKRLYKSRDNRMISGVCAGIAEYFGIHAGPSGLGGVQPAGRQRTPGVYHRRHHRAGESGGLMTEIILLF